MWSIKIRRVPIVVVDINKIDKFSSQKVKSINYKNNYKLFTLFTSGSTGKPKAIIHGVEKYLKYAKFTTEYFFFKRLAIVAPEIPEPITQYLFIFQQQSFHQSS